MNDTKLLVKILKHKHKIRLANLLTDCFGDVNVSNTYGNYFQSLLSTYVIYAPLEKFYKLKKISDKDKTVILESIIDIYPHKEESPEIVDISFELKDENETEDSLEESIKDSLKSIRIFISYNTLDKDLAGKIKTLLSNYGLEVFLAHEDISPSKEWEDVILQNLDSTDIFIPLITKKFLISDWTDQESGIAFIKNKFIIPLVVDTHPYGFLGKYQELKINQQNIYETCLKIINTIVDNDKFYENMSYLLINSLKNSSSFDDAGIKANVLSTIKIKNSKQMDLIIKSIIDNNQIRFSFRAFPFLSTIFNENKKLINKKLFNELNQLMVDDKFNLK